MGSPPPCGVETSKARSYGLGVGVHTGGADAATLPDPPPQGGREKRERPHGGNRHQAAFDADDVNDANVLPSAASRFNSGAGSSEGSLVSLA